MFATRGNFNSGQTQGGRPASNGVAVGSAALDTSEKKIGDASLSTPSNGSYANITGNFNTPCGSSPFTIECWIRPRGKNTNFPIVVANDTTFASANNFWGIYDRHASVAGTKFALFTTSFWFTVANQPVLTSTTTVVINTWYHIAITRNAANLWTMYVDGTSEATRTFTGTLDGGTVRNIRAGMGPVQNDNSFFGYIDELRISSIVRYTANFTPQTTPFQNDGYTRLLQHFDGANGATTFPDDN
jgi:hypothetical protein